MNNIAYIIVGFTLALLLVASGYTVYSNVVDQANQSVSSTTPEKYRHESSENPGIDGTGFERWQERIAVQV